jgi:hypothetical protein
MKASIVSLALIGLIWAGLTVLNRPGLRSEFVVERKEQEAEIFSTEGKHDEVLAVVKEMQSELETESKVLENHKVKRLVEILDMDLLEDADSLNEFSQLSAEDKAALRTFYRHLELEDRSGRGTTVFLLGRAINDDEDLRFLGEVLHETPCLSLENCSGLESALPMPASEEDEDPEAILGYPQVMAVRSIEAALVSASGPWRAKLEKLLEDAAKNRNPYVSAAASAALRR